MNGRRTLDTGAVKLLLRVYALPVVAIAALVALKVFAGIPIPYLTRDPWASVEQPFYLGLYSNLNMVLWGLAFGAVWLTYWAQRRRADPPAQSFWRRSAITTTLLFLDDLFGFHDAIFPEHLRVPELLVYGSYGMWFLWYFWRSAPVIRRSRDAGLLLSAVAFFALSASIDVGSRWVRLPGHFVWEDGTKLLGVAGWSIYFFRLALARLTAR
jgi:hypothetical protein